MYVRKATSTSTGASSPPSSPPKLLALGRSSVGSESSGSDTEAGSYPTYNPVVSIATYPAVVVPSKTTQDDQHQQVGSSIDLLDVLAACFKIIDPAMDASLRYVLPAIIIVIATVWICPAISPLLTIAWWIYFIAFTVSPTIENVGELFGVKEPLKSVRVIVPSFILAIFFSLTSAFSLMVGVMEVTGDEYRKEIILDMTEDCDFRGLSRWLFML